MNVISPEVDIDNLPESSPDRENPIVSPSTSATVTVKTTIVFSSIDEVTTKSLKVGGSFTLTTSISTWAVANVPSTLTE